MQWFELTERSGCLTARLALVPWYRLDDGALLLFDSGAFPEPGLFEDLASRGERVVSVLSTHLHWDHMGNNTELIRRFGAVIYAHPEEIEQYARRGPMPYVVEPLPEGDRISICGAEIEMIPTPGHTPGHLAFVTPDGVCCMGDAMMDLRELSNSKLPYMEDVDCALKSMERLRDTGYDWYVASHYGAVRRAELPALVDANVEKELQLYALLRSLVTGPVRRETLVLQFLQAADVHRLTHDRRIWLLRSVNVRVDALLRAGEITERDGVVFPADGKPGKERP